MKRKSESKTRRIMLKALVDENGISPEKMAKLFGISERTWYYWMNKPEKYITIERLAILWRVLRMSEKEVLELVKGEREHLWKE